MIMLLPKSGLISHNIGTFIIWIKVAEKFFKIYCFMMPGRKKIAQVCEGESFLCDGLLDEPNCDQHL